MAHDSHDMTPMTSSDPPLVQPPQTHDWLTDWFPALKSSALLLRNPGSEASALTGTPMGRSIPTWDSNGIGNPLPSHESVDLYGKLVGKIVYPGLSQRMVFPQFRWLNNIKTQRESNGGFINTHVLMVVGIPD